MNTNKRNTIQRSLVLDAVRSMHNHPTSAEVYECVREHHPSISRATVYRNLAVLSESGEIKRVKVPGGADHYDYREDPHFHGVCRECGAVCDIEIPGGVSAFEGLSSRSFQVEECSVVFTGLCEACAAKHADVANPAAVAGNSVKQG